MRDTSHRTGVCVIRVWIEAEAPKLRAHLITTLDVETGDEESTAAAGVEAISGAVREWLGRFEQIGSRP
jgi:hypothetical protein